MGAQSAKCGRGGEDWSLRADITSSSGLVESKFQPTKFTIFNKHDPGRKVRGHAFLRLLDRLLGVINQAEICYE